VGSITLATRGPVTRTNTPHTTHEPHPAAACTTRSFARTLALNVFLSPRNLCQRCGAVTLTVHEVKIAQKRRKSTDKKNQLRLLVCRFDRALHHRQHFSSAVQELETRVVDLFAHGTQFANKVITPFAF
jgi:hypothetical protein